MLKQILKDRWLTVVVMIGLLGALAVVSVNCREEKSKRTKAESDLETVKQRKDEDKVIDRDITILPDGTRRITERETSRTTTLTDSTRRHTSTETEEHSSRPAFGRMRIILATYWLPGEIATGNTMPSLVTAAVEMELLPFLKVGPAIGYQLLRKELYLGAEASLGL